MSTPYFQSVDPQTAPDPVTPQAAPSDPSGYASVTPHGRGPAPYDIQADVGVVQSEIQASFQAAGVSAGQENAIYPPGPRQAATEKLVMSPQGFSSGGGTSGYDVTDGFSGEGGDGWSNDVQPGILETPVQGQSSYPVSSTGTG